MVFNEDLYNILNNITTIIIFVWSLQLPFSDESVLNEVLLFNVAVSFTQRLYLLRNVCHSKGHLRLQDSFDAPVQLPSFSPVQKVIYFTAVCVTSTSLAEDLPGVIGKSESHIPCQDCFPTWERGVGEFPHQPRRHVHLHLHIAKSNFLSITKCISLLGRSFSPTQKKTSKFPRTSFLPLKTNWQDKWLSEKESLT
jgi:hypothetical protein